MPSVAVGAIIGKGGESIAKIQKETGARIKLSKVDDLYPGESLQLFNWYSLTGVLVFVMVFQMNFPNLPILGEC